MAEKSSENVIGIDLGTTYTRVGIWNEADKKIEILPDEHGNRSTPSIVAFTNQGRVFGQFAANQFFSNAGNTVFDYKRLMGKRYFDKTVKSDRSMWPFSLVSGPQRNPLITVDFKQEKMAFKAEELCAMILKKTKENAESYLGCKVNKAVITVPAFFDKLQRQATRDAAKIAGLEVVRLLNDPTAAAIAYSCMNNINSCSDSFKTCKNILVYDLGGGTFDAAVIQIKDKSDIVVKAVKGDTHLGGQDFSNRLLDYFVEKIQTKSKVDICSNTKALMRLRKASEQAKRELSYRIVSTVDTSRICHGSDILYQVTRAKFEQLNHDLMEKTIQLVKGCIEDAGMDKKDIGSVILVGGSSKIPKVKQLLNLFFGKECSYAQSIDMPQEKAVAYGAAFFAANLYGNLSGLTVQDVTPMSIRLDVHVPQCKATCVFIPHNTPIPFKKLGNFRTPRDNMTELTQNVYEGDNENPSDNVWLGKYSVAVPPQPKRQEKMTVLMEIDDSGILYVTAVRKCSDPNELENVSLSIGLIEGDLAGVMVTAEKLRIEDDIWMEMALLQNRMDEELYNTKKRLKLLEEVGGDSKIVHATKLVEAAEDWLAKLPKRPKAEAG